MHVTQAKLNFMIFSYLNKLTSTTKLYKYGKFQRTYKEKTQHA